ncbi:hypothetical protein [Vibrio diabolicus]|uniref:hypothetical protein n=1 Tax=Vibrio diabolicus TaxID=50719 RepID=UPI002150A7BA|nr:hypothetical protein [Vibrio diabolicus]MCE9832541.1 hypothetical protein [Vibrio diabolicus]MCS0453221.1 hypothetical protein [Vibrio diabolicus]
MRKTEHNKSKPNKLRFYPPKRSGNLPKVDEEVRENIKKFLGEIDGNLEFKYYRNLKQEVPSLTKGRCSYCGKYTELSIEHYRPKDAIAIDLNSPRELSKPGYFWLASDWYNLHPACTPCNILKKREVIDLNTKNSCSKVVGKGNLFPLYGNSIHAPLSIEVECKESLSLSSRKVKKEKPLLLNPSKLRPQDIFRYGTIANRRGKLLVLAPKVGISAYKQSIAQTTIDILGLNSKEHSKARMDTYTLVNDAIANIESIEDFDDEDYLEALNKLHTYIDESNTASYLGMVEVTFGSKLKLLADELDQHIGFEASTEKSLLSIANSIDRFLNAKGYEVEQEFEEL